MTVAVAYPLVQLRYVSRTGTGHTPSRSRPDLWIEEDRTIPWMTLADVGQLRAGTVDVITETVERITPAGVANSSAVVHPAGTVFLSRTASVGFSAMMGRPMAVSQDFMTWTPGPLLDGRFLLHVLRGMRPRLLGLMYGSTHKTIYMPDLLALRTPLPPIERQQRSPTSSTASASGSALVGSLSGSSAIAPRASAERARGTTLDRHADSAGSDIGFEVQLRQDAVRGSSSMDP